MYLKHDINSELNFAFNQKSGVRRKYIADSATAVRHLESSFPFH